MSSAASSNYLLVEDEGSTKHVQCGEVDRVNEQIEVFKAKLSKERRRIEVLDERIIEHETKALEQRRQAGGESAIQLKGAKLETEKQLLIDRLNKKLVSLNTKISENTKLREKIDELRNSRCRYDEIYSKLERDIQLQSERMAAVLEQGKADIRRKDRAAGELEVLTKTLEEARAALKLERAELERLEAMIQQEDGQFSDTELRLSRPIGASISQKLSTEATPNEEEDSFNDEKALDEALAKVFELTGFDNVDIIIKRSKEAEELQFSLFSRVNQLEADATNNETKIADAKQELKMAQRCGVNSDTQRQKEVSSMEERRKQLDERLQDVDAQYEAQMDAWNSMKERILQVHEELGLSLPEDLVGTNSVNESNVFQYLAAIESRASEILSSVNGDYDDLESTPLPATTGAPLAKTHALDLPSATTEENPQLDNDDGERPFTMEELQESLRVSS